MFNEGSLAKAENDGSQLQLVSINNQNVAKYDSDFRVEQFIESSEQMTIWTWKIPYSREMIITDDKAIQDGNLSGLLANGMLKLGNIEQMGVHLRKFHRQDASKVQGRSRTNSNCQRRLKRKVKRRKLRKLRTRQRIRTATRRKAKIKRSHLHKLASDGLKRDIDAEAEKAYRKSGMSDQRTLIHVINVKRIDIKLDGAMQTKHSNHIVSYSVGNATTL